MMSLFLAMAIAATGVTGADVPKSERLAAWRDTIVAVDETSTNGALMTYDRTKASFQHTWLLAKIIVSAEVGGEWIGPESAHDIRVNDFPGGVRSEYELGGVSVTCEYVPLMTEEEPDDHSGAWLMRVATEPPTRVRIEAGGGREWVMRMQKDYFGSAALDSEGDVVESGLDNAIPVLESHQSLLPLAARSSGQVASLQSDRLVVQLPEGTGWTVFAFAKSVDAAWQLASAVDPEKALARVHDFYEEILSRSAIKTPEPAMDAAFRAALYNLEYSYLDDPPTWIEAIHHWISSYHMEHTATAEWIGQVDRAREVTMAQLENLLPGGFAPSFQANRQGVKVFGGTEHFLARQIEHHWKFTADRDFLEAAIGPYERILEGTRAVHDPDNDNVFEWGSQIGNQEDYIYHPFGTAGATIEWINMLRIHKQLAEALGDDEKVERIEADLAEATTRIRDRFWKRELGRFIWFVDPMGVERLEGQYYNYTHAMLWGVLDDLDGYTGMRHFHDRLVADDGRHFVSNNFPAHGIGPGMQASAGHQPWASFSLAQIGMHNEALLPLKRVAEWVMNPFFRGSFMEHNEMWPEVGYFSPAATMYIQGVIEALFGLRMDRPDGALELRPAFPDHWPEARLTLPQFSAHYVCNGEGNLSYRVDSDEALRRRVRWMVPPSRIREVLVNGKPVDWVVRPAVDHIELAFITEAVRSTVIELRYEPVELEVTAPGSVAEGDTFDLHVSGAQVLRLEDRSGLLASWEALGLDTFRAELNKKLLDPYGDYGRLGLLNFGRRTFFLFCDAGEGLTFWHPVNIAVLPPEEAAPLGEVAMKGNGGQARLVLRNNRFTDIEGRAFVRVDDHKLPLDLRIPARSEREVAVDLPPEVLALLSVGDNPVVVALPNGSSVDTTLVASELFRENDSLMATVSGRLQTIALPVGDSVPDAQWRHYRKLYADGHAPWKDIEAPLKGAPDRIELDGLPGISFDVSDRTLVPVAAKGQQSSYRLALDGARYRKFYLLVVSLLDNHDVFAPAAKVVISGPEGCRTGWTLHCPGQLDWFFPRRLSPDFATAPQGKRDRHGLLPLLKQDKADWEAGTPILLGPGFPQKAFWADSLHAILPNSVLNVLEFRLKTPMQVDSLTVSSVGCQSAIGLIGVVAEKVETIPGQ